MVYVKAITQLIGNVLRFPSEGFVRFLVGELGTVAPGYEIQGRITGKVIEKFKPIIKKSIQGSLVELMTRSLNQEMAQTVESNSTQQSDKTDTETEEVNNVEEDKAKINTTEEELAAFEKIKLILQASKNYKFEAQYKDTVSYFGVNLGKVTWWFLRLYLSSTKKTFIARLGIDEAKTLAPDFVVQEIPAATGEAWSKVTISSIEDLDKLAPIILRCYELEAAKH